MKKIDIYFINNTQNNIKTISINITETCVTIKLNIFDISNYEFGKELIKINNIINIYSSIKRINIIFDKSINIYLANKILSKTHNILYQYYKVTKEIKLYQVSDESNNFMHELDKYKNIVMDPNTTPDSYLSYIKSRIPPNYITHINNVKDTDDFPLTKAVGLGSRHNGYFIHIEPSYEKPNKKNIYLVGKAITFDSGGMNLKKSGMEDMKIDMTGSAIIISVLNLLNACNYDLNYNLHLIIPIVENMISNNAVLPGNVITTAGGKTVEITNTDAEGRLCLADCFEFIQSKLSINKDLSKCLIIDIATLTGNVSSITNGISSIIMGNDKGSNVIDTLTNIGEDIGEYLDFIKIREEYFDILNSKVADIKNCCNHTKSGCIMAGVFLNYFVNKDMPWVHIDLGDGTYTNETAQSHGVNLLFEFLKKF